MPYCQQCGQFNPAENKFCESCGKPMVLGEPLPREQPAVPRPARPAMGPVRWPRRLPAAGGLLALICFFFPWVAVSCQVNLGSGTTISAAGYEIATGNYSALRGMQDLGSLLGGVNYLSGSDTQMPEVPAYAVLWLLPILGLAGLVALNGRASGGYTALFAGVLGILGMIIFSVKASEFNRQLQTAVFQITYEGGYWGSWAGFLWQSLLAFFTVRLKT